jgi:chitodextrinase
MFRLLSPPHRTRVRRRRAVAALCALALVATVPAGALANTGKAKGTTAASAEFSTVGSGVPARPAAPASPDPSLTAYPLASATGALNNPDKGLVTYYSAGSDENSSSVYPHSMQWSYFALSQVMTNASNCADYDWSAVDSMLSEVASYGNTAAIRFYLVYPSGSPADGIPACFNGNVSTRSDTYNDVTDPDYDSPFLINALGKFIAAFAARYDGDPRLGFIQIGLVGNWGENHTWPYNGDPSSGGYPNYMPTNADFAKIVDDFANDFHRTQVEVRYPYTAGGAASGLNIGYHDDSFCALEGSPLQGVTLPESLGGASWSQLQLDLNQGTENKWITDSMGGEVYPPIQSDAFANYPNGSTADDVDNMEDCINLTHATWMLDQGSQSTSSTDAGTDAAVEDMGYNFTANNAYFTPSASGSAEVGVQITNNGVAPFYYPWTMSLGLENSSGQVVKTWNTPWDIRTVEPANIQPYPDWNVSGNPSSIPYGYPQYFQTDVNLSGVSAGSYTWVLEVDNPEAADSSAAKPLLFSNATQNANGWLGLGSVSVGSASAGTAPNAPTNLTATGTASTIGLSWTAPASGTTPAGYEILRDGSVIATTQSTSFTDQFLPVSAAHTYTVEAFDAAGDTSAASAAVAASTTNGVDTTPPTAPTGLAASGVTGDSATLSWNQSSDDTGVAGYDVYRNGTLIGSTTYTTYTDIELAGDASYQYTVKAYDPAGNISAASGTASVTTGASETTSPPGAPTALSSPSQAGTSVDLSWTAPGNTGAGIAGYDVYRNGTFIGSTTTTEEGTAGSPTPTIYTDTGLTPGTTYSYTVAAFDAAGDTSAQSSATTATTVSLSGSGGGTGTVYEGDASANTLAGGAVVQSCSACLDGNDVGYIGEGGTLTFPDVTESAAGSYTMTVSYVDGDAGRSAVITVNGTPTTVSFTGTNNSNWDYVQTLTVTVSLNAGTNTIEFSNPSAYAPDIDHIVV